MNKDIVDLFDRNNTLELSAKDKLGKYNRLMTYPDAQKALGEYVTNLLFESESILSYDDKDEDQKIEKLKSYFAEIKKQWKL